VDIPCNTSLLVSQQNAKYHCRQPEAFGYLLYDRGVIRPCDSQLWIGDSIFPDNPALGSVLNVGSHRQIKLQAQHDKQSKKMAGNGVSGLARWRKLIDLRLIRKHPLLPWTDGIVRQLVHDAYRLDPTCAGHLEMLQECRASRRLPQL
jgi:hypothetical protein